MSILSRYGYLVPKDIMKPHEISELRSELTTSQLPNPNVPNPPKIKMYEEFDDGFRVPRAWGMKRFGEPSKYQLKAVPTKNEANFNFEGLLRVKQQLPFETTKNALLKNETGMLCLMTGSGKTVVAIAIMCALKQRTCILVHKSFLLEQWKQEITRFAPKLRIGVVQQTCRDWGQEFDVVLIMVQSMIRMTDYRSVSRFGFMIIDEAHHLPCRTFSDILFKMTTKYTLALSATPERNDGLSHVIQWHIGDMLFEERPNRSNQLETIVEKHFIPSYVQFDPKQYSTFITRLCANEQRNSVLLKICKSLLKVDDDGKRSILILTERVQHAQLIADFLQKIEPSTSLVVGKQQMDKIKDKLKAKVIVSTYIMMAEGISISHLNTIVFASPKRDITQAMGRIYRKIHSDINPKIVDIVDTSLRGQSNGRNMIYTRELGSNFQLQSFTHTYGCSSSGVSSSIWESCSSNNKHRSSAACPYCRGERRETNLKKRKISTENMNFQLILNEKENIT